MVIHSLSQKRIESNCRDKSVLNAPIFYFSLTVVDSMNVAGQKISDFDFRQ